MSRLFVRIWLTFWAVLAVTLLMALAVDYGLALRRARDLDRLSPRALAEQGAEVIARNGEVAGRHWILVQHNRLPELEEFVVTPDGRELLGRSPAEVARARAQPRRRHFPAEVIETVRGRPYRFIFLRVRSLSFDLWDVLLQPWVLAGLILTLSGAGAALLARSLTRPIDRLQARVRAIAEGELESRMDPRLTARRDEFGALSRDVDHMAGQLSALVGAREALLRDVSHELRAPLARLRAVADLARRRGEPAPTLTRIDKEIDRLDALVGQILRFSRLSAEARLRTVPLDLAALVESVVEDARLEAAPAGKRLRLTVQGPVIVDGEADLLRSAVENILRNAIRFSPPKSLIDVSVAAQHDQAWIEVADRGPGVRPEELAEIFEPFHGEGSGAGLGLAITRRVADLHSGSVIAANRPGGGLAMRLSLPASLRGAAEVPCAAQA